MTTDNRAGDDRARLAQIEREILARRPEHAIDPTLDRIGALVTLLGDPQRAYPVIHITGTNGKTSTARMIESLLRARGLRTGLFTSPHLSMVGERIAVDGEPLSEERFVEAYDEIKPYVDLVDQSHEVPLSFFEVLTGMAFAVFADAPVDVCVLEVGMGGTWDNTNVADGAVAVVTPISLDHTRHLGSTVAEIATDKAGIIKPGAIAVLAQQSPAAAEVLLRRAADVGASVAREGIEFGVLARERAVGGQQLELRGLRGEYHDVYLPLFGAHQASNAACALAAVEAFAGVSDAEEGAALDPGLVREGFGNVRSPGRLEVVRRSPTVIIDAAHNPGGMAVTVAAMQEEFSFTRLTGVVAVSKDKDVAGILAELEPLLSEVVVTRYSSDIRSTDPQELAEIAREIFGEDRVLVADRLDEAIDIAVGLADDAGLPGDGGVLITGSVITAGDARILLAPDGGMPAAETPSVQPSRHSFTAAELS